METRRAVFAALIAASVHAGAEDPFSCVDPDARAAFLDYFKRGETYSSTLPAYLDSLAMPPSWVNVGTASSERNDRTVFKVEAPVREAHRAAISMFESEGWTEGGRWSASTTIGFKSGGEPEDSGLCNAAMSSDIHVRTLERGDSAFVSISHFRNSRGCGQGGAFAGAEPLMMRLPRLVVDEAHASQVSEFGSGGSKWGYFTRAVASGNTDRVALLQDLNQQIEDLGWQPQSSWSSEFSAGSVWVMGSGPEERYLGVLETMTLAEGEVALSFRVAALREQTSGGVEESFISSSSSYP